MRPQFKSVTKQASILTATALLLGLALTTLPKIAFSQGNQATHHVVWDMAKGEDTWDLLITHVNNLREAFADEGGSEIEVVFYGPALKMLLKTNKKHEEGLKKLADAGVILSACQNAMRFYKVKSEDLFPFANEVDSGLAQIVRRQEQGSALIRH